MIANWPIVRWSSQCTLEAELEGELGSELLSLTGVHRVNSELRMLSHWVRSTNSNKQSEVTTKRTSEQSYLCSLVIAGANW